MSGRRTVRRPFVVGVVSPRIAVRVSALVLALIPVVVTPQEDGDVLGWRDTRWGMSEADVAKALTEELTRAEHDVLLNLPPGQTCRLQVRRLQVGLIALDATLCFTDGKLSLVSLDSDKSATSVHFRNLEELLTEKYGPATLHADDVASEKPLRRSVERELAEAGLKNDARKRLWRFKTTVIALEELDMGRFGHFVKIQYRPASATDKL